MAAVPAPPDPHPEFWTLQIAGPDLDMAGERAELLRALALHLRAPVTAVTPSATCVVVRAGSGLDLAAFDGVDELLAARACVLDALVAPAHAG